MRKSNNLVMFTLHMPPRIMPGTVSDRVEGFHLIITSQLEK